VCVYMHTDCKSTSRGQLLFAAVADQEVDAHHADRHHSLCSVSVIVTVVLWSGSPYECRGVRSSVQGVKVKAISVKGRGGP
jgi:hypothetical protein